MRIVIIRHGIAKDQQQSSGAAQEDALRPLTREGRRKMRRAAGALTQLVPSVDVIASSPLLRAAQTADLISEVYEHARTVQIGALAPRKHPAALVDWLNAHPSESTVALVGHEPHLSTFLCWLLTGLQESFIVLKKGGCALIEIDYPVTAGHGKLLWLLRPSQLRRLR